MADNLQSFKWTGINPQGQRKSGVLQAATANDAQIELKKTGIEVISLVPQHAIHLTQRTKKIKVKDIQLFTRYLSTMMAAGLPIIQAMDVIGHDQANPAMKTLITTMRNDIASGKSLAETFGQHPKHFGNLYCSLIKAGEKSGTLDKILNRLAGYLERSETLKRKIKKALTYPIAVISVAFIVSGILLIFVVPQFQKMFASFGGQLPTFTLMIVNLSNVVQKYWYIFLIVIIGSIKGLQYLIQTNEKVQRFMDRKLLKVMVIGDLLQKGIIARYTRTLSTTLEAGMPIVESMKSMAKIMGNSVYSDAILQMCDDISNGHTLSASMTSTKLFPNMVIQMISVGEISGKLSDMLSKIADYYEEEVNTLVDNLSSLLEPLIMAIMGVIVGTFVVAMYLPIFKIGSLF